jgi:hypothetical protein
MYSFGSRESATLTLLDFVINIWAPLNGADYRE